MCGHGGVYNHVTKTVQYHDCYWHRCQKCCPQDSDKIIDHNDQTHEDWFKATMKSTALLLKTGYCVIEDWVCEVGEIVVDPPWTQTKVTSMQSCMISRCKVAIISRKSRWPCTPLRMRTCQSLWASVTTLKESPPTSVKETQRSWSAYRPK